MKLKDGASFCYCAYILRISGYSDFLKNLPSKATIFLHAVYDYVEKADVCEGYQGVTRHFSDIIELKFGKKLSYILCILTLF